VILVRGPVWSPCRGLTLNNFYTYPLCILLGIGWTFGF